MDVLSVFALPDLTDCFKNSCKSFRFISRVLLGYHPGISLPCIYTFQQFRSLEEAKWICSSWTVYAGLVSSVPSVVYSGVFPFQLLISYLPPNNILVILTLVTMSFNFNCLDLYHVKITFKEDALSIHVILQITEVEVKNVLKTERSL
jgi:hypothetical protein